MLLFQRSKPVLLGVDIGATSVKMVELAQSGSGLEVQGYAVVEMPAAAAASQQGARIEMVGNAVKKAVRKMGTRLTHAATAVPSLAVFTKTFQFPASLSEDDIAAQIELEAEHAIPYPVNELSLDFVIQGESDQQPDMLDVLVAAARKEYVEDRAAGLEWAGLKPELVDVEPFIMERACSRMVEQTSGGVSESAYAIIDVGAIHTTLYVIHDG
jgi:type IV pilus assembly protein PilM